MLSASGSEFHDRFDGFDPFIALAAAFYRWGQFAPLLRMVGCRRLHVLSPKNRFRRSLVYLPFAVVMALLAAAGVVAWQRSCAIAELTSTIAHADTPDAIAAVHKLAVIPGPPIQALVAAASVNNHEVAAVAQVALNQLLDRWRLSIDAKNSIDATSANLTILARTLALSVNDFSTGDHAWLADVARFILQLADKIPPTKAPLVAADCDKILSVAVVNDEQLNCSLSANHSTAERVDRIAEALQHANLERSFADFNPQSSRYGADSANNQSDIGDSHNVTQMPLPGAPNEQPSGDTPYVSGSHMIKDPQSDPAPSSGVIDFGQTSSNADSAPRDLSPSALRMLPPAPVGVHVGDISPMKQIVSDSRLSKADDSPSSNNYTSISSRDLLRLWLSAEPSEAKPIERELAKRGFGTLTTPLVRQYFSDSPKDRQHVADRVLAQPGAGAAAWLMLLAQDADPDVRLFAVSFMATSNDPALVEAAWNLAIRDRDPRVADIAGRLRDRRAGNTLRR